MQTLFDLEKTEEFFMESCLALLSKKPLHKISVQELCQKTGYNRSTFYYYFTDIYDLFHQSQERLIQRMISQLQLKPILTDQDFLDSLTSIYQQYGPTILLLSQQSDFYSHYKKALKPFILDFLEEKDITIAQLDWTYQFIMGGILSLLDAYYQDQADLSTETLALFIQELIDKLI